MLYKPTRTPKFQDVALTRWLDNENSRLANFLNYQPRVVLALEPVRSLKDIPVNLLEGTLIYSAENIPNGPIRGLNYWDGTQRVKV